MFNLEVSIAAWRRLHEQNASMTRDDLDELEQHVRDQVAALAAKGMNQKDAFEKAIADMGDPTSANTEYRKVFWRKVHREHTLGRELSRRRMMLGNYLKAAYRSVGRHPGYAALNIAGLTLGLFCCLLIFQYVTFERSFDDFHEHADEIYRLTRTSVRAGEDPYTTSLTGHGLAPAATDAIPEIIDAARIHPQYGTAVVSAVDQPGKVFEEERLLFADASLLDIFTFPLLKGDPDAALAEPGTLVLSESAARKYFGNEDPIGKTMQISAWIDGSFRVAGIVADVPNNSHMQFDILVSMIDLLQYSAYSDPESAWNWQNFYTYVRLQPGARPETTHAKLTAVLQQHMGEQLRQSGTEAWMQTQPLRAIRLDDSVFSPTFPATSPRTVYFFTIIGLITLAIALVNYVNLATARALDRAREVGVRKAIGAQRKQLVAQFIFESALTNLAALFIAIGLAALMRPVLNAVAGTDLPAGMYANPAFWLIIVAVWSIGTVLAGLYPAFVLSSFRPSQVLKGQASPRGSRARLRQGLVILQFAASVALVAGTAIVYAQLNFVRNMDLGLDLEQVVTASGPRVLPDGMDQSQAVSLFKQEMRRIPGVLRTASSNALPGQGFTWYTSGIRKADAPPESAHDGAVASIDTSFASVYGLELIAGRGFERMVLPVAEGELAPVILNESARRAVGFETPEAALDQVVAFGGREGRVVGVFEDVNWSSAHEVRENAIFYPIRAGGHLSVRVATADLPGTLAAIERAYTTLFPGNPFNYSFADEQFDQQYAQDRRFAALFTLFAGLAIAIACLGLFGLASFTAQQRRKEIGVRKVLGASAAGIVGLLTRDFVVLIGIAFVIASPVAYVTMQRWLDDFAYSIDIGPVPFVLTGILVLAVALLTVSYQSIRAALADPALTLRSDA